MVTLSIRRRIALALLSFIVGAGVFAGTHIFAQSNTSAVPTGALSGSGSTASSFSCAPGYYPQEYDVRRTIDRITSTISPDSSKWYACVTAAYLYPPMCQLSVNQATGPMSTQGQHGTVLYQEVAGMSAVITDPNNPPTDGSPGGQIPLDISGTRSTGTVRYTIPYLGAYQVTMTVTNVAGQSASCGVTVYDDSTSPGLAQ